MADRIEEYLGAGMNQVAAKPIDRNELALAINNAMGEDIHHVA